MKTTKTFETDKPRLAVTLGDPAGIGPEVVLKALADPLVKKDSQITVIGSKALLKSIYSELRDLECVVASPNSLSIIDVPLDASAKGKIIPGMGNAASGAASFAYLEKAIALTLAGEFDGIVTGPISKSLWKAAGHDYPGQTEVLAKSAGVDVDNVGMLFVARSPYTGWLLRTLIATTHIPLSQVATTLTPELMSNKLELLIDCLRENFGIETPRIAISGLNPHSGETGLLGTEEQDWLIPWLEEESDNYPEALFDGPEPPDTLWVSAAKSWYGKNPVIQKHISPNFPFTREVSHNPDIPNAYLALYHDQGLIPVKLMAFDRAVNTTIGLPFVRTSPDHGTAFDIAREGVADATSMKAAIQLAGEFVQKSKSVTD